MLLISASWIDAQLLRRESVGPAGFLIFLIKFFKLSVSLSHSLTISIIAIIVVSHTSLNSSRKVGYDSACDSS